MNLEMQASPKVLEVMSDPLQPVLAKIEKEFDASVQRLQTLLAIPSISTDPAYEGAMREAAQWLKDRLEPIGFEVALRETGGHPIVLAHAAGSDAGAPRLLYYGHYDVQPPDPLELWEHPPFEPTIREGKRGPQIVARGASDDKGQVMTFVEALSAWYEVHGGYPASLTLMIEGEEESGSENLEPFISAHADELAADICIVSDTGMLAVDRPAITYMLRGLAYFEVTLHGPSRDLHSGMYGGAVPNPINLLAGMLAGLHDAQGRVQLDGFYDEVRELSPEEAAGWQAIGIDAAGFLADVGLSQSWGEEGRSILERVWSRPSCDVNGIWGGYTGEGAKTVIPAKASAKLSCRLVPDQGPQAVVQAMRRFFETHLPPGCRVEVKDMGASPAIRVPVDSPYLDAARAGMEQVFDRTPVLIGCGGSIPVVGSFKRLLGLDTLLVGFGLDDDKVHSPNEKFELACYRKGIEAHAAILDRLSRLRRKA